LSDVKPFPCSHSQPSLIIKVVARDIPVEYGSVQCKPTNVRLSCKFLPETKALMQVPAAFGEYERVYVKVRRSRLLQVVMSNTIEQAVRQAGVIYLKNLIGGSWAAKDVEASPAAIATGQVSRTMNLSKMTLSLVLNYFCCVV